MVTDDNRLVQALTEKVVLDTALSDSFDQIYELNLRNKAIAKIENLSKCVRLRSLDLSCNNIKKIENLERCEDLKELKLFHNSISKMESLSRNTQLQTLLLQSNQITSIDEGTMKSLIKLTTLRLDYNNIIKLDGLIYSRNLTYLDLSNNNISRIEGLDTLVNLEDLYLGDNNISIIENLSRCSKLREIRFSNNRISSGASIPKTLTQLSILRLDHNIFPHLTFLPSKSLTELFLQNNELCSLALSAEKKASLNGIADLFPNLEILDVTNNRISDLESVFGLGELTELVELVLSGNPVCSAPNYPYCVWAKLPQLQLLDGIPRDPNIDYANAIPTAARPSTATRRPPSSSSSSSSSISPVPPPSSRPPTALNPSVSLSRPFTSSSRPSTSSSRPTTSSSSLSPTSPPSLSPSSSYTSNPSSSSSSYTASSPYFNTPSSYAAFAASRPTTPYSARPVSALSARPASSQGRIAPACPASASRNGASDGEPHSLVPLMAPASSMSKVHRMPSLNEVEQQFSSFKTHIEKMSSDVLQRTKYIREVIHHPNTLGKEFTNQTPRTPRETISSSPSSSFASSPSSSFSSSPSTSSSSLLTDATSTNSKNRPLESSDSDNDSEVREVMEKVDKRENGQNETEKSKPRRIDSREKERRSSRATEKDKLQDKEDEKEKATTTERKPKPRSSSPSITPTSITPSSSISPSSSPSTSRKKKSDHYPAKLQSRNSGSPNKQPTASTYVPSDIHSFVNNVMSKESDDEEDFADYNVTSSFGKSGIVKTESRDKYSSPTNHSTQARKATPRSETKTETKRTKSAKPKEAPKLQKDKPTTFDDEALEKSPSYEKVHKSIRPSSEQMEGQTTTVPKLAIPQSDFDKVLTPKKSTSARSFRGPVGPVFDEPDEYNDDEFEDEKIAKKRGQPTYREMSGYKSFRTPRSIPPTLNNNHHFDEDEGGGWNLHSVIT